jgi:glycoside/pentoside/hexuronide:cation symporter, GPH family
MSKLSIKEKLGFSLGEIGGTISWQAMMFYLAYFYTDVFGLPATTVGFLLFIPRFFDAFVDPIVGAIADRTNTRYGKFRPFILWIFIPYCILMVLMYITPNFGMTGKIVYAYVTYIVMMVLYSFMMTPYNALGGVITNDHIDRTSLQSFRFMMAFIGGLLVRGVTTPLVKYFGGANPTTNKVTNEQHGFMMTMIVFASISLIAFFITFISTKERVQAPKQQKTSLKTDLKDLLSNKPWVILFIVSSLNLIYVGVWSSSFAYYFKYYTSVKELNIFGFKYDLMSTFNVFGSLIIILVLAFPTANFLTRKLGKRNTLITCFSIVFVSITALYTCKPADVGMMLFWQFIQSAAAACTMPIIWGMYADAADYSEWKNGRRATGLVFSAVVLGQKAGIALGAAIPLWILGSLNYNKDLTQQPDNILLAIKLCMSLIPAAIALLTTVSCFFYKLTNKDMDNIQAELTQRRALV